MKKLILCIYVLLTPCLLLAKDQILKISKIPEKGQTIVLEEGALLVLDGEMTTPKIQKIEPASPAGKPQLNVLTGMQNLENGVMKSYPYRISVKSMDPDRKQKPILIHLGLNGKSIPLRIEFK